MQQRVLEKPQRWVVKKEAQLELQVYAEVVQWRRRTGDQAEPRTISQSDGRARRVPDPVEVGGDCSKGDAAAAKGSSRVTWHRLLPVCRRSARRREP